jgi:hypothetical protein
MSQESALIFQSMLRNFNVGCIAAQPTATNSRCVTASPNTPYSQLTFVHIH